MDARRPPLAAYRQLFAPSGRVKPAAVLQDVRRPLLPACRLFAPSGRVKSAAVLSDARRPFQMTAMLCNQVFAAPSGAVCRTIILDCAPVSKWLGPSANALEWFLFSLFFGSLPHPPDPTSHVISNGMVSRQLMTDGMFCAVAVKKANNPATITCDVCQRSGVVALAS